MIAILKPLCRHLPWNRRAAEQTRHVDEARQRLRRAHDDWVPLAAPLVRIDREIDLNDWTATAKRIFSGRRRA